MMNNSNKFKTAICKHFEQSGECKMGQRCHFAHGQHELRTANDPVPQQFNQGHNAMRKPRTGPTGLGFSQNTGGAGNYKTVQCKYFEKGSCKFENNCTFAHGTVDQRQGNSQQGPRPMRTNNPSGPNAQGGNDQNIQNQVAQAQISTLGAKLEAYHSHDQEILPAIKQANELVKTGNIQESASILYSIMNRTDKREGDMASYQKFQAEIQSLGNSLYEQLQTQMISQTQGQGTQSNFEGGQGFSQQSGGYNNYSQGGYGGHGSYGGQQSYGGHQGGYGGNQQYGGGEQYNYQQQHGGSQGYGQHHGGYQH